MQEKQNMLESFYKYIVENLLIEWFKHNIPSKGSRFYFIVEKEEQREGLLQALRNRSTPISIYGIFEGADLKEECYDTFALNISNSIPQLIIADDQTANEDYLTTLRNVIGQKGDYENFGVVFILTKSVLSSLITASQDLEALGGPLHYEQIEKRIKQDVESKITKDLEKIYLKKHLGTISRFISDGSANIFDFESMMTILAAQTIKSYFNKLDMFEDEAIYHTSFNLSNKEMETRVDKNKSLYSRVYSIMNSDEDHKAIELEKFLDERLSRKIAGSSDDWKNMDFHELLESENIKAATSSLELKDIKLLNEGVFLTKIISPIGKKKKCTKNFVIVCDQTDEVCQKIIIVFNKKIVSKNESYTAIGETLHICLDDQLIHFSVGKDDNYHEFFFVRLHCPKYVFDDIRHDFTINKKGDIVVKVPDEKDIIFFGNGSNEILLTNQDEQEWTEQKKFTIKIDSEDEADTLAFVIRFGESKQRFLLKINSAKPIPPLGPDSFPVDTLYQGIKREGIPFKKIKNNCLERGIYEYWREYLIMEQQFLDNNCQMLLVNKNQLTGQNDYIVQSLDISSKIKDTLNDIFRYFKNRNTIPSLCPIDDELRSLYENYCNTVIDEVKNIPIGQSMSKRHHDLTRLGIVVNNERLYMSPFHPVMVAYILEYCNQSRNCSEAHFAKKLLSPFYLIPYLTYKDIPMRPYCDSTLVDIRNWLIFEHAGNEPQERANDITTKMVKERMKNFISNFSYFFQDIDSPIIINSIGISDDKNLVKGIIEFIKSQYIDGVQRVELHEYVDDLLEETLIEKLNRLDSLDAIERELRKYNLVLEQKDSYSSKDIIHQLFTRVTLYKHSLAEQPDKVGYCHIAFYQMGTGTQYITPPTNDVRTELAFNGLISIPSTFKKGDSYQIGFGTKGINDTDGFIHPMAMSYNNLYGNEKNGGSNMYNIPTCVTKKFEFKQSKLLNSIYEHSNWVTFLNPEVDINFFFQQGLYVVHYTDQYSINAKYDSITVTKHIDLYKNLLKKSYEKYALSPVSFENFNKVMHDYFNSLNGSWMLKLVKQRDDKVREKMSLVATCIVMQNIFKRYPYVIWIPISLDEILRVTGEIGLKMESIFSKKTLGATGVMSDDLLFIGLDISDSMNLKMHFYPVEVKASETSSFASKGCLQVCHTWLQFKEHLFENDSFETKIFRTFFASQYLINAEKLRANQLLSDNLYEDIEKYRYELLNLKWDINELMPDINLGVAAVVSFYSTAHHSLSTKLIENVPICEIHFSEKDCVDFVVNPTNDTLCSLIDVVIDIDNDALYSLNNGIPLPEEDTLIDDCEFSIMEEEDSNTSIQLTQSLVTTDKVPNVTALGVTCNNDAEVLICAEGVYSPIKIVVGHVKGSDQEVVFEPNNPRLVSHPNMGIIGTMGTGKTQFAMSVIAQLSKEGIHNVGGRPLGILIFDYKGDYKDSDFLENVDGKCYKINFPFNPLKLVVNGDAAGMNIPAITADRIADSFAKAYGLGIKQQSNIKRVIIDTYLDAGITRDSSTWDNNPPTIRQVIDKYFETYDSNDKAYALFDKLNDYDIFTSDTSQCLSMFEWLSGVRVIDLTDYPDDTKKVIVSLILDLFDAEMRQLGNSKLDNGYRELRAMIMVDEAHHFLKKDFNSLRSIISEGRMFGVGMILSTQSVSDFKTSIENYSQFILSWVIHHVNYISKNEMSSIFGSDPNLETYIDYINKAHRFESISKIGHRTYGIRDLPYFELVKIDKRFNYIE